MRAVAVSMNKPVTMRFLLLCVAVVMRWSVTCFIHHHRFLHLNTRRHSKAALQPQVCSAATHSKSPITNQTQANSVALGYSGLKDKVIAKTAATLELTKTSLNQVLSKSKSGSIKVLEALSARKIGYRLSTVAKKTYDCGKSMGTKTCDYLKVACNRGQSLGVKTMEYLKVAPKRLGTTAKHSINCSKKLATLSLQNTISFTNHTIIVGRNLASGAFKSSRSATSNFLKVTGDYGTSMRLKTLDYRKIVPNRLGTTIKDSIFGSKKLATSSLKKTVSFTGSTIIVGRNLASSAVNYSKTTASNVFQSANVIANDVVRKMKPMRNLVSQELAPISEHTALTLNDNYASDSVIDVVDSVIMEKLNSGNDFNHAAPEAVFEVMPLEVEEADFNAPMVVIDDSIKQRSSLHEPIIETHADVANQDCTLIFEAAHPLKRTVEPRPDSFQPTMIAPEIDLTSIVADTADNTNAMSTMDVTKDVQSVGDDVSIIIEPFPTDKLNETETTNVDIVDADEYEKKHSLSYTTSRIKNFFKKVKLSSNDTEMTNSFSAEPVLTIAAPITKMVKSSVPVFFRSPINDMPNIKYRPQPRPIGEEMRLQAKYAAIPTVEERAFQILVDLRMIEIHTELDGAGEWE